jgi:hypothetical protein
MYQLALLRRQIMNNQQSTNNNQIKNNSQQKAGQQSWNSSDKTANSATKDSAQTSGAQQKNLNQGQNQKSNASTADRTSKEFSPRSNMEVNPGRYNEDLTDSNETAAKPDSFQKDQNSTQQPVKGQNNDSQAV